MFTDSKGCQLQVAGCRLWAVTTKQCTSDLSSSLTARTIRQSRGYGCMLLRSAALVSVPHRTVLYHWQPWPGGARWRSTGVGRSGAAEALDDSPPLPSRRHPSACSASTTQAGWQQGKTKSNFSPFHTQPVRLVPFGGPDERRRRIASAFSTATATVTATTTTTITRLVRT